jgi:hypothetical protein
MYAFGTGDLEGVMKIPIPFRKWLIGRWNKQKEKENKAVAGKDPNEPLSPHERSKALKNANKVQNDPAQMHNFMQSVRNKK